VRPASARRFRELHAQGCFAMPNPWDMGTAVVLAQLGFAALASSSAGPAFSHGLYARSEAADRLGMLSPARRATRRPARPRRPTMFAQGDELKLDRDAVERYVATCATLLALPVAVFLVWRLDVLTWELPGVFLSLALLGAVALAIRFAARAYARRSTAALSCRLRDARLEVESGLLFRSRVELQLAGELVVSLQQGPLMKRFGLWELQVQHAQGTLHAPGALRLLGVVEPEALRRRLFEIAERAAAAERHAA